MIRTMLGGKIHRARVTGACIDYIGSVTIDAALMEAARMQENEQVHIVNLENGHRWVTYAIPGGPGDIVLNGGGARLCVPGDILVIMSYVQVPSGVQHEPQIVFVDEQNRPYDPEEAVEHGLCN